MGILDVFRGAPLTESATDDRTELLGQVELLTERLEDLEREDRGWIAIGADGEQLTRDVVLRSAARSRLAWQENPLIQRAVNLKHYYVWGQGLDVDCDDPDVNAVLQGFLDDTVNQAVLFGHQAHQDCERTLQLDGQLFIALFTTPRTGRVKARTVPLRQVIDIVCDPQDAAVRWFYLREWTETTVGAGGTKTSTRRKAYHPDVTYRPALGGRPTRFAGVEVRWDAPMHHVRVGSLPPALWGLSEVHAALPWARGYVAFLEDWATIARALSRYAFNVTAKKAKVRDAAVLVETETGPGASWVSDGTSKLEPIGKVGATLDSDSGKPLAMMVGAAVDLPHTLLTGDVDQGNLATAKTLDRPTELAMMDRQALWTSVYQVIGRYVIDAAVRTPSGRLRGVVARDDDGLDVVTWAGYGGDQAGRTVNVRWPAILEPDVPALVKAIVEADGTGKLPPLEVVRLLLTLLDIPDPDEVIEKMTDDNGEFIDPAAIAVANAGQAAVDAFRRGADPASLLR